MTTVPPDPRGLRGAVDLSSLVNRAAAPDAPAAPPIPVRGLVAEGTDANFGQFLELSKRVPVIVDLWAEWCEPCKQLTPTLEKLIAEYAGRLLMVTVDVDANPQLTQAFQAQSIPTVAVVIGGQPLQLFTGALAENEVRDVFEKVLQVAAQQQVTGTVVVGEDPAAGAEPEPEPLPPHHAEAYEAIDRGDYELAIKEYRTAIAQNPGDALAVAGLAQVSLLARLQGISAEEVRANAAAAPSDVDAQLAVADLDTAGGHIEDAFDRLLALFPTLDADGKNAVRQRMLELFEITGATDPRVIKARSRLTALLY